MNKMQIMFKDTMGIMDFVNKVGKYPYNMDMKRGRFNIDAKSLIGVMNMGLDNKIELVIYDDSCDDLKEEIQQYIA